MASQEVINFEFHESVFKNVTSAELIYFALFTMRHPVVTKLTLFKRPYTFTFLLSETAGLK